MSPAAPGLSPSRRPASAASPHVRVMHVVPSLNPGGTERLVIEIAKTLMPQARPVVCCLDTPGSWAAELTDLGVPVVALQRGPGFRPALGLAIGQLARRAPDRRAALSSLFAVHLWADRGAARRPQGRLHRTRPRVRRWPGVEAAAGESADRPAARNDLRGVERSAPLHDQRRAAGRPRAGDSQRYRTRARVRRRSRAPRRAWRSGSHTTRSWSARPAGWIRSRIWRR